MDKISVSQYAPEYNILADAYLGCKDAVATKLDYLARMAQPEKWSYQNSTEKNILYNYLCFTYDRIKQENKFSYADDQTAMCFNTGLLTNNGTDIYAYFTENTNSCAKPGQKWYLYGFKQRTDREMAVFQDFPEIADYFTEPADFIYDKKLKLDVDLDHVIDDNYDRFVEIGLEDKYIIKGLLYSAVDQIINKVKRNYKLAIPQYYTDKSKNESKIQLLLPLFLRNNEVADLALVVDKNAYSYIGKTILPLEWAYVNSRRIVKPDVEWLKI